MAFDSRQFEKMLKSTKELEAKNATFVRDFLMEMGARAWAQTKKLTPVQTGNLRNKWELSGVFMISKDVLGVVIFNPVEYASWVEDGHMQRARWVPGTWKGKGDRSKFIYIPGAKTGMLLRDKWIPGQHMARVSIAKVQMEIPARYERAFKQFAEGIYGK